MPRGGRRAGRPGATYPQRSDLSLGPRTAPVTPIPGQGYGKQTQQVQMQRAGNDAVAQIAERQPKPPLPAFDRPSERPGEPITAGLPIGPGPGPEILSTDISSPEGPGEYHRLARFLPVLELAASRPGTSQLTRDFVRRIRGAIPPETVG